MWWLGGNRQFILFILEPSYAAATRTWSRQNVWRFVIDSEGMLVSMRNHDNKCGGHSTVGLDVQS